MCLLLPSVIYFSVPPGGKLGTVSTNQLLLVILRSPGCMEAEDAISLKKKEKGGGHLISSLMSSRFCVSSHPSFSGALKDVDKLCQV